MSTEDREKDLEKNLEELNYSPNEDIFNREEHIPIDGDGNPIRNPGQVNDEMPFGLDVPGAEDDDNFEQVTDQLPDEENNYYSPSDNEDENEQDPDTTME